MRFLTAIAAALVALASASSAGAAVTIGQLAPSPSPVCMSNVDRGPGSTVTSGSSYVVPATGGITSWTVTSWSHNATGGAEQTLTMKVFRKVADPATYVVVGHDGPRNLTESTVNTFPTSIPAKPGDFLGLNAASPVLNACAFATPPGNGYLIRNGSLADGESGDFTTTVNNFLLNVTAVVAPSNSFTFGATTRNKKKGTATLTVNLPNPGELTASGKDVNVAGAAVISKAVTARTALLLIKARGKKKHKLNDTGKVKLNPAISYTPTGGDPSTQSTKVKLKKKL